MAKERAKGGRKPRKKPAESVEAHDLDHSESPGQEIPHPDAQNPHHSYPLGTTIATNKGWYCKDDLSKEPQTLACRLENDPQAYEHAECGTKSGLLITDLDMTLEQVGEYEDIAAKVIDLSKKHPYVRDDLARRLGYNQSAGSRKETNWALDEKALSLAWGVVKYTVALPYILPQLAHQKGLIKHPFNITLAAYIGIIQGVYQAVVNPEALHVVTRGAAAGITAFFASHAIQQVIAYFKTPQNPAPEQSNKDTINSQ